ncbi:MAG: hypothetical protein PHU64_00400 [Candidatus Omnitrophica bacterium]|nr:hypothetical protein [Candidatus Omnitrophota bacterium]MDD5429665.1 hypothetical protein [Candidatus Omnitrophota bacterium]
MILRKVSILFFSIVFLSVIFFIKYASAEGKWQITGQRHFGTRVVDDSDFAKVKSIPAWCGVARIVNCGGRQALEYACLEDALWTPYTESSLIGPIGFDFQGYNELVVYIYSTAANSPGRFLRLKGIDLDKTMIGKVGEFTGKITPWVKGKSPGVMEVEEYHWLPPVCIKGIVREENRCQGERKESTALVFDVKGRKGTVTFFISQNSPVYSELRQHLGEEISLAAYVCNKWLSEHIFPEMSWTCFLGMPAMSVQWLCD